MKKLTYIFQMNGFLQRRKEDRLPAGAVLLYLVLFEEFNRKRWQAEWVKMTARDLLYWTGLSSSGTLYRARDLLASLGYIKFRVTGAGRGRWVEYKLLPLYDDDGASDVDENEKEAEEAEVLNAPNVPNAPNASQKITPEDYEQLCMVFADCLEREITKEERTKVLDLVLEYGTDDVLDALAAVREGTVKSMEFCETFLRRRSLGTEKRVSRPTYPNEAKWAGWKLA